MLKIKLQKGQNLYFTSDTHYSHKNICRGVTNWGDADDLTRDFKTLDHMNDTIVNNINNVVGENDILIHLGDWSFGGFEKIEEFRNRLVCKNIHLVLGNHDHHIQRNKENIRDLFSSVHEYLRLEVKTFSSHNMFPSEIFNFILCHYPIASWHNMNDGVIHLHGHVHLPPQFKLSEGKAMDVGVDGNNLDPYSLREIISIMSKQPIRKLCLPKDHHERRL
jgi:calcineurin-like phosphoesterase family protein